MTNKEFAKKDARFRAACERAGIAPTARQASKYRRGFGRAFQFSNLSPKTGEAA